jgi:hypothetical protein
MHFVAPLQATERLLVQQEADAISMDDFSPLKEASFLKQTIAFCRPKLVEAKLISI